MHELGLVKQVIDSVEHLAEEQRLTRVASVTLEIGEVSGVLPEYLLDCWNWARQKSGLLKDARLETIALPATTRCEDCAATYPTVEHGKRCPACQSEHTVLLCGDEFIIKETLAS